MKKLFTLLFLITVSATATFAQRTLPSKLNIGADAIVPVGTGSDVYSFGTGFNIKLESPVNDKLKFILSAGVSSLFITNDVKQVLRSYANDYSKSRGFVPLQAGLRYYFVPNFYGEGLAGAVICTHQGEGTSFGYSPGIGIILPLKNSNDAFDIGFRYDGWSKDSQTLKMFAIRIAYKINL